MTGSSKPGRRQWEWALPLLWLFVGFGVAWGVTRRDAVTDGLPDAFDMLGGTGGVLVVFQARDCPGAQESLRRWNAVSAAGAVAVTGLLLGAPADTAFQRRLLGEAGIEFGVVTEAGGAVGRLAASLGYERTPLVLAFDTLGRLALVADATSPSLPHVVTALLAPTAGDTAASGGGRPKAP